MPARRRGSRPLPSGRRRGLVARGLAILLGRVLVTRRALGEEGRRAEGAIATHAAFDHDVDAIRERIGREATIDHREGAGAIGDAERVLTPARIALDSAGNDPGADLHAHVTKRRIGGELRLELRWSEIILTSLANRARHQISDRPEHQQAADQEFVSCFHLPASLGSRAATVIVDPPRPVAARAPSPIPNPPPLVHVPPASTRQRSDSSDAPAPTSPRSGAAAPDWSVDRAPAP